MAAIGTRIQRRMLMVEQAATFPPLAVLASWVHALMTHFLVLMYLRPEFGFRMSRRQIASILLSQEALPGISICGLGTFVSACFLVLLCSEFYRTPAEVRGHVGVRVAYISAALLALSCLSLWDSATWLLTQIAR